jgi:hypothetical protein
MSNEEKKKPTIDERLEALAESLELARLEQEEDRRRTKELDRRERLGYEAILAGFARYFQIMREGRDERSD